jgi:hypothetical protein
MPAIRPLNPLVYVGGIELHPEHLDQLIELRIETEMRLPGRVTLRFRDPQSKLAESDRFNIGKTLEVKIKAKTGTVSVITGTITGVGYETTAGSDATDRFDGRRGSIDEFFVVAHDNAYHLTRNWTVKGLEQVTPADVATTLAGTANLTLQSTLSGGQPFPVMSQLHSDYELLNAVADHQGVDWWMATGNTLHIGKAKTTSTATLKLGEDLTSFSVKGSALTPKTVSVRGYASDQKQDLTHTATASGSQLWPQDVKVLNGVKNSTLASATMISAQTLPSSVDESTVLAGGIRDRLVAASTSARGECSLNPAVVIGSPVTIERAGPANGTYHVTKVEHVVRRDGHVTRFWAGDRKPTSLVDSLASRPAPSLPARHLGLVLGIVTNLGDGENAGMLRVKFPTLDTNLVSAWARFLAPSAGPSGRGLVMLPEVGDEVLVGFEEGDMHRPVVLGGLYVGTDKKDAWPVQGGSITDRRYTSMNGHVVMVQDGDGDPNNMFKVTIKGKKGDVILRVGGDKAEVTTPDDIPLELSCGKQSSMKFDGKGNIEIKGLKVTIAAQLGIELKSETTLDVKAGTGLSLQSQTQAELKGAMVNVTAQGPLAAKGAIVQIN